MWQSCQVAGEKLVVSAYADPAVSGRAPYFTGDIANGTTQAEHLESQKCEAIDCNDRAADETAITGNKGACECGDCLEEYTGSQCQTEPAAATTTTASPDGDDAEGDDAATTASPDDDEVVTEGTT